MKITTLFTTAALFFTAGTLAAPSNVTTQAETLWPRQCYYRGECRWFYGDEKRTDDLCIPHCEEVGVTTDGWADCGWGRWQCCCKDPQFPWTPGQGSIRDRE
ncbi:hypothetical protein QBC35DRAFT_473598 [Podospora australis]|uniref:Uncharacterized protein n=1 Tax=Podospora australis TaxID=1536484 RepID=A0AAN6WUI1_9PEZI|nr:hypothetical protein QBC35DRAFT_473598 [Podospora australis]